MNGLGESHLTSIDRFSSSDASSSEGETLGSFFKWLLHRLRRCYKRVLCCAEAYWID